MAVDFAREGSRSSCLACLAAKHPGSLEAGREGVGMSLAEFESDEMGRSGSDSVRATWRCSGAVGWVDSGWRVGLGRSFRIREQHGRGL